MNLKCIMNIPKNLAVLHVYVACYREICDYRTKFRDWPVNCRLSHQGNPKVKPPLYREVCVQCTSAYIHMYILVMARYLCFF